MRKVSLLLLSLALLAFIFVTHRSATAAASFPRATPSPTPIAEPDPPETLVYLDLSEPAAPSVRSAPTGGEPDQLESVTMTFPGGVAPANTTPRAVTPPPLTATGIATTWQQLLDEDFENTFPQDPCQVHDLNTDPPELMWGADGANPHNGEKAGWPARGGADGLDPAVDDYIWDMRSWLICGPYDLSQSEKLLIRFARWMDVPHSGDFLFAGVSLDGQEFTGVSWTGVYPYWRTFNLYFDGVGHQEQVWVAWAFWTDGDNPTGPGPWIDDLEVWRYNSPAQACLELDAGNKGVVVDPYETVFTETVPIIRPGEMKVVDGLVASDAHWVRLLFLHRNGVIQLKDYDIMIDTLCAQDIGVLGVINQQTLLRQDFNVLSTAADYRQAFAEQAGLLALHYEERIKYWEVWNEEDIGDPEPPFVDPKLFAPLLIETYQAIKGANGEAQVLYGGLSSAWDRSHIYFENVYAELDDLGGARPFDYLALHPYPDINELPPDEDGLNPDAYLRTVDLPGRTTLLDRFLQTASARDNGNKKIWVTEIGWNSAQGEPNLSCWEMMAVTRTEQAVYLKRSFDILFNEVPLWNQPGTQAVEKVFWFQYRDVGIDEAEICGSGAAATSRTIWERRVPLGYIPRLNDSVQLNNLPWWFGLYESDKTTAKPSQCAFAAYPNPGQCTKTFLPLILKNY